MERIKQINEEETGNRTLFCSASQNLIRAAKPNFLPNKWFFQEAKENKLNLISNVIKMKFH